MLFAGWPQRNRAQLATFAAVLALGGAGAVLYRPVRDAISLRIGTAQNEVPAVATAGPEPSPVPVVQEGRISTIIDLPGDPVFVRRSQVTSPRSIPIKLPLLLSANAPLVDSNGYLISTPMIPVDGGFMSKFPDVGQGTADEAAAVLMAQAPSAMSDGDEVLIPLDGIDDDGGDSPTMYQAAPGLPLQPENSNQIEVAIGGRSAQPSLKEAVIRTVVEEKIGDLLVRSGFSEDTAKAVEDGTKATFNVQSLPPGSLAIANGVLDLTGAYRVTQFAIYENNEYVGSLSISEAGGYGEGAEPFVPNEIFDATPKPTGANAQYTLSDGLYSAGIRNNMPEPTIRDAILLISKLTDMKQQLQLGETLRVLYSRDPRDKAKGTGKVFYVGLTLPTGPVDCYVFEATDGSFRCVDQTGNATGGGGIFAPVRKGIPISSTFGMRMHPILHILRLHAGVDWATPIDTPVMAVADGTVEFAGVASGFGNHIRLKHKGYETSYSHLNHFAPGIAVGVAVTQGETIGFSGNSGLSTGPHMHFQYYLGGVPVDPLLHLDAQTAALDDQETTNFAAEKKVIDDAMATASAAVPAN